MGTSVADSGVNMGMGVEQSIREVTLDSRRITLRPVLPSDYGFLYEMSTAPGQFVHWRFRGQQPAFEEFVRLLHADVFRQYVVVRKRDGARLGLAVCYQATFRNRFARLALQGVRDVWGTGALMEAGRVFVDFLLECYDFEKLYAECPSFNMPSFQSGIGGLFVEEGCLRGHERFLGRSWDVHLLALYREQWNRRGPDIQERIARRMEERDGLPLSYEEFCGVVEEEFDLEEGEVRPGSQLADELGFDSIQFYELLCMIEELGVFVDDFALEEIKTVEDAYFHYIQNCSVDGK